MRENKKKSIQSKTKKKREIKMKIEKENKKK